MELFSIRIQRTFQLVSTSNYIFRLPQDANKEVFLEIIAFNFDKMID